MIKEGLEYISMNAQLEKLYNEDIADRYDNVPDEIRDKNDLVRIAQAQEILTTEQNLEAIDYHHAALIFQHGETVEHFQQAHQLAMKAVELGDDSARWLAAAALDRSLLMDGKPQKYGTQFSLNSSDEWELAQPIDPAVTDEERAEWHVPPLEDALKAYKEKYNL